MARAYLFVMMLAACCLSGVSGLGIGKKTTALKPTPNEKAVAFKVCTRSTRKPHLITCPCLRGLSMQVPHAWCLLLQAPPPPPVAAPSKSSAVAPADAIPM